MRFLPAIFFAALAVSGALPTIAGKVTIDPNIIARTAAASFQTKSDPRLAQTITYTATNKRLHSALAEISKATGVTISAGKSLSDWQVRDLPVIVCVKDLPLGKLLRSIADATHLAFTSTTIKNVKRYRIWRDAKREKQLAEYFRLKSEADEARTGAMWDAWLKLSKMSDAEIERAAKASRMWGDSQRAMSKEKLSAQKQFAQVMALLPESSKDRYMAGECISLCTQTASLELAQALRVYYQDIWQCARVGLEAAQAAGEPVSNRPMRELSDNAINKIVIKINNGSSSGRMPGGEAEMNVIVNPNAPTDIIWSMIAPQGDSAMFVFDDKTNARKDIKKPTTEYAAFLVPLGSAELREMGRGEKFKIDKPKEDDVTYADIASMVSNASGYSIIAEDFVSHTKWSAPDIYNRDFSLADLLRMDGLFNAQQCDFLFKNTEWYVDIQSKLLVGSEQEWWAEHHSLAPESIIAEQVKGVNGNGLEIDAQILTLLLSDEQYKAWVMAHRDLGSYSDIPDRYRPLWELYASLSPADKAKAKSADGIALASICADQALTLFAERAQAASEVGTMGNLSILGDWLSSRFDTEVRFQAWLRERYPMFADDRRLRDEFADLDCGEVLQSAIVAFPECKYAFAQLPTDPTAISKLRLRLLKTDMSDNPYWKSQFGYMGEKRVPHSYILLFEGDETRVETCRSATVYPIFSEKRIQFLQEAKKKNDEKNSADPAATSRIMVDSK
ncbi:MAG: hypothetical protein NT018_01570 [Armatimonadetes bacterium]|nr:hypothetical protein [Armatimonadota bacterium]